MWDRFASVVDRVLVAVFGPIRDDGWGFDPGGLDDLEDDEIFDELVGGGDDDGPTIEPDNDDRFPF